MYYRVKGTRTRKLEVGLSVEEAQQLRAAIDSLIAAKLTTGLTDHQFFALDDLGRQLSHAMSWAPPKGIMGCEP